MTLQDIEKFEWVTKVNSERYDIYPRGCFNTFVLSAVLHTLVTSGFSELTEIPTLMSSTLIYKKVPNVN